MPHIDWLVKDDVEKFKSVLGQKWVDNNSKELKSLTFSINLIIIQTTYSFHLFAMCQRRSASYDF